MPKQIRSILIGPNFITSVNVATMDWGWTQIRQVEFETACKGERVRYCGHHHSLMGWPIGTRLYCVNGWSRNRDISADFINHMVASGRFKIVEVIPIRKPK